jgi:hypothetical protein
MWIETVQIGREVRLRMVVPPGSSHTFRILMVWNDVAVVSEVFVAQSTFSTLLRDLAIHQPTHFRWGSQFPITSRVMRIINPMNSGADEFRFWEICFSTAAEPRSVDRAKFISTKSHGGSFRLLKSSVQRLDQQKRQILNREVAGG